MQYLTAVSVPGLRHVQVETDIRDQLNTNLFRQNSERRDDDPAVRPVDGCSVQRRCGNSDYCDVFRRQ